MKYTIFATNWGYFGLVAEGGRVIRTALPGQDKDKLKKRLLVGLSDVQYQPGLLKWLEKRIQGYFRGRVVEFSDVPVALEEFRGFKRSVLSSLKGVGCGQTVSYQQLAGMAGSPGACRAVGNIMATNPMGLIIPCHRVIKSDGSPGGFSSGRRFKQALLNHEMRMFGKRVGV